MKKVSIFALSMGSGGAERVISLLLPKLNEEYEVTLFLMFNVFHYSIPANVTTIVASTKSKLSNFERVLLIPKTFFMYLSLVKKQKIDISISFLTVPNLMNALMTMFYKKAKVVISERSYPSIEYRSSSARFFIYKRLIPLLYSKANVVFSNSEWINDDLKSNFGVKGKMEVVYNPIILPPIKRNFIGFDKNNSQIRFINVGRIFATKNQKMVVDAFSMIDPQNYHLTFLGDGVMKNELENLVNKNQLSSRMKFQGNVKNVNDFLLESDCFILSSNSEGFPNALLEAMGMGLPVISTNCKSGPLELLNNNEPVEIKNGEFAVAKYGILVNVNDSKGLSKAVNYLINNRQLFLTLSELSVSRAKDFEINTIYQQFKEKLIHN